MFKNAGGPAEWVPFLGENHSVRLHSIQTPCSAPWFYQDAGKKASGMVSFYDQTRRRKLLIPDSTNCRKRHLRCKCGR